MALSPSAGSDPQIWEVLLSLKRLILSPVSVGSVEQPVWTWRVFGFLGRLIGFLRFTSHKVKDAFKDGNFKAGQVHEDSGTAFISVPGSSEFWIRIG
ncbi:hypothetical protein Baya_13729 [Bagarius yarrelli]|uniref:Uncharacterized protein n=1 Tax=Bagarius yarrelli TaxID=175774 RepID=A0A556V6X3_BAGYA|nr:hypothetical protein Baya_13729 [Bagarius yarrelli]